MRKYPARVAAWSALAVAAVMFVACPSADRRQGDSQRQTGLTDAHYPGELRPPAALGGDWFFRQRVTIRWRQGTDDYERSFDAVLQKQGPTLELIALSPMGQPGFIITQVGTEVTMKARAEVALPFPPRFILLDVQRTFFDWLSVEQGAEDRPLHGGKGEVGGELVTESRAYHALVTRTFARLDGQPPGVIRVAHSDHVAGERLPRRATLVNGWFGYSIVIETVEQTRLER